MAKKQTFEDKVNKKKEFGVNKVTKIKVIHAHNPNESGNFKFKEKMYTVPNGKTPDQFAKELFSK